MQQPGTVTQSEPAHTPDNLASRQAAIGLPTMLRGSATDRRRAAVRAQQPHLHQSERAVVRCLTQQPGKAHERLPVQEHGEHAHHARQQSGRVHRARPHGRLAQRRRALSHHHAHRFRVAAIGSIVLRREGTQFGHRQLHRQVRRELCVRWLPVGQLCPTQIHCNNINTFIIS